MFARFLYLLICNLILWATAFAETTPALLLPPTFDSEVVNAAHQPNESLARLINEARELHLADKSTWRALVHYRTSLFGSIESEVDGRDFFNSAKGKVDPEAELAATLASFFSNDILPGMGITPSCRFLARFDWLSRQLDFEKYGLATPHCEFFDLFFERAAPEALTVVFPSSNPNSASSIFGHTLLRVDSIGRSQATHLLDYSINFAAIPNPDDNPILYGLRGMYGGYPGKFTVQPYHMKMREYAQIENRDIWEYTLNLTPDQIRFVLMHLYELVPTYFDYYYISENCAYEMLTVLDIIQPDAPLSNGMKNWALPIDTLKSLRRAGMVRAVEFRPSQHRVLQQRFDNLTEEEAGLARQKIVQLSLAAPKGENSERAIERQAAVLDAAFDLARYERIAKSELVTPSMGDTERRILGERSKLAFVSPPLEIHAPGISPDKGHGTSRLSLGATRYARDTYWQLGWRPAYHDLLDPIAGYAADAQVQFLDVSLQLRAASNKPIVNHVTLLDVISLVPRNAIFVKRSWRINLQYRNLQIDRESHSIWEGTAGAGYAWQTCLPCGSTLYAMATGQFQASPSFNSRYSIAPGLELGWAATLGQHWRIVSRVDGHAPVAGNTTRSASVQLGASFAASPSWALKTHVERRFELGRRLNYVGLNSQWYF